jgi:Domain of unknown function (DUF4129)
MTPVIEQPPGGGVPEPRPRRPRRGGRAEVLARVALVLLLLGVAAIGLSGRRRLDWGALADAPGDTWTGLVLVAAAAFVVFSALHTVARMLRATRDVGGDAAQPSIENSRVAWYGYLAAFAVIAVTAFLVYLLVKSAVAVPLQPPDPGRPDPSDLVRNGPTKALTSTDKLALLCAVLVGAVLAVTFVVLRRRAESVDEGFETEQDPAEQEALAGAVAAAEVELDSHGDDTRAAIIAAYLAMERQLMASGTARQASDTPTDFLVRATAASRVSRGAATRLTELFREARFSTHPMADTARADAARSLARVAADLAESNHPAHPRG